MKGQRLTRGLIVNQRLLLSTTVLAFLSCKWLNGFSTLSFSPNLLISDWFKLVQYPAADAREGRG